jgi:signal transduction histidine kinase
MGIEQSAESLGVVRALRESQWTDLPKVVHRAAEWLERVPMGTSESQLVIAGMVGLATHEKWEVRRAVALVAGTCRHAAFDDVLSRLAADTNARVQQAAETASLRRRDWRAAGLLGREHEQRLERLLEDIQYRFGSQGRAAVRRVANEMVSTFVRELYHEVIKHITPLDREVQRLRKSLRSPAASDRVVERAAQIERDLSQLKAVLKAMREYAATPELVFSSEPLRDVVDQAVRTTATVAEALGVMIENRVGATTMVDLARARFVQALSNVLYNAVEAYAGTSERPPIVIDLTESDTAFMLHVRDRGTGMSPEVLADSRSLFSTKKSNGTGVGLPLAIKIIESEHEGRVEIESAENEGTTVTLTIPRYRHER